MSHDKENPKQVESEFTAKASGELEEAVAEELEVEDPSVEEAEAVIEELTVEVEVEEDELEEVEAEEEEEEEDEDEARAVQEVNAKFIEDEARLKSEAVSVEPPSEAIPVRRRGPQD